MIRRSKFEVGRSMFAFIAAAALTPSPDLPPIAPEDRFFFGCITRDNAMANYVYLEGLRLRLDEQLPAAAAMRKDWLTRDLCSACWRAAMAWNLVDDICFYAGADQHSEANEKMLIAKLEELRRHIGPEAYYAGRLAVPNNWRAIEPGLLPLP